MSRRYFIQTYGCQMNEADSERIAGVLEKQGYVVAEKIDEAEVVVINTCSVRESAENRVFGLINNLTKKTKDTPTSGQISDLDPESKTREYQRILATKGNKRRPCRPLPVWRDEKKVLRKPKIVLTGCIVGSAKGDRRRYTFRQLKMKLPQVDEFKSIDELLGKTQIKPKRKHKHYALVPIMEGCNHFCTYCVVPYARGKEVSRAFEEIICEVEELARRGYKEIILLGQNVNSYGKDFFAEVRPREEVGPLLGFALLLQRLHEIEGIQKISFITSNPWDLSDEIIEAMTLPKIDRHFHLPVQSGDDEILKKMNRPYTAKQYLDLIKKIRKKIPDIKISTDLIVGFPGETKKQFENTVRLCKKVGFEKAYIARYSPRPGTAAFKLKDDVSPEEKKRRWRVLEELINSGVR